MAEKRHPLDTDFFKGTLLMRDTYRYCSDCGAYKEWWDGYPECSDCGKKGFVIAYKCRECETEVPPEYYNQFFYCCIHCAIKRYIEWMKSILKHRVIDNDVLWEHHKMVSEAYPKLMYASDYLRYCIIKSLNSNEPNHIAMLTALKLDYMYEPIFDYIRKEES